MSFWTRAGIAITDLEVFKNMCDRYSVEYELCQDPNFKMQGYRVHAFLRDKIESIGYRREAYLVRDGGAFKMIVDNDVHYSSLSGRLGQNGGKLTRDYATEVLSQKVAAAGGMVDYTEEMADGSVVMKVSML